MIASHHRARSSLSPSSIPASMVWRTPCAPPTSIAHSHTRRQVQMPPHIACSFESRNSDGTAMPGRYGRGRDTLDIDMSKNSRKKHQKPWRDYPVPVQED